ncbi:hypothetical protein GWK36_10030 [Caldichromatium japonicum]|uniref:Uncharacterized protein n=1 Tax=Caldichromatium japonicum TaxID=2699430 RepID=A0A6G7VEH8_9GAMM|nr:hypothetical protein [Caldichromatium japonicum]QIK38258.1 hypothetical protein GWK36_10030 [Caldichromatium japonicum]
MDARDGVAGSVDRGNDDADRHLLASLLPLAVDGPSLQGAVVAAILTLLLWPLVAIMRAGIRWRYQAITRPARLDHPFGDHPFGAAHPDRGRYIEALIDGVLSGLTFM